MTACNTISVTVEDFTGQNTRCARGIPTDATVGELAARANGESLVENDRVGDVLREKDVVTLTQNVTAG